MTPVAARIKSIHTSNAFHTGKVSCSLKRRLTTALYAVGVALLSELASAAIPAGELEFQAVLGSSADAAHGRELFTTCAACHGPDGSGATDGTVPAIAAQPFSVIAKQLIDFRHDTRRDERMEHFSDRHHLKSPNDIADVATYISQLPAAESRGQGPGVQVQQGGRIYLRSCAVCHGAAAQGNDGSASPRLAGQHYAYLLQQFEDVAAGRRPNLPDVHVVVLKSLDQIELSAVADYLSRLPPLAKAAPPVGASASK